VGVSKRFLVGTVGTRLEKMHHREKKGVRMVFFNKVLLIGEAFFRLCCFDLVTSEHPSL
jgi:hypothetical protein